MGQNCRYIVFACPCGREASNFKTIGLTDTRELYVAWVCHRCHCKCYSLKPLEECIEQCPTPDGVEFSIMDIAELHAMRISLPTEEKK